MLIYLHGLNSSSRSYKAAVLRVRLAPLRMLAPSYPAHRPAAAVDQLSRLVEELSANESVVVVGSSMGAFYGQFLARRFPFAHLFMINPALKPWLLLPKLEGQTLMAADGEVYSVTREGIERLRAYGIENPCDGAVPTTLFMDEGDEVIDYRIAQAMYRRCGRLFLYPGGDHAFQHLDEAIAVIRRELGIDP
jgi:predicted esterase YcpF (UPF0227 family)